MAARKPFMRAIYSSLRKRFCNPCKGIYKCILTHKKLGITKEQIAGKVLPHLIPLSIDNNLNLSQFNSFMTVIKDMLSKLELEHKTKLEQLHMMQEQQKSLDINNDMNMASETHVNACNQFEQVDTAFQNIGPEITSGGSDVKEPVKQQRKVSLTLEEKQKLAKEQEQALKFKSQQPLKPKSVTPVVSAKQVPTNGSTEITLSHLLLQLETSKTAPLKATKDLTNTLMDNMASMKNNGRVAAPPIGLVHAASLGGPIGLSSPVDNMSTFRNMTNGLNTNMAFQSPGLNMVVSNSNQNLSSGYSSTGMPQTNMMAPAGIPNFHTSSLSSALSQPSHPSRPTADMSAFDNLFGFQKPKVSINQMAQQKPNQWLNQYGVPYQASQDFGGSTLGTQAAMVGQTGFSIQGNPFFSPQNFAQPAATTTNSSASKDLKDIFG